MGPMSDARADPPSVLSPETGPDRAIGTVASRMERRFLWGTLVISVLLLVGGGVWFGSLWRHPAWAAQAQVTWRIRKTCRSGPTIPAFRARYAQELLLLAAESPPTLRRYLDWRAQVHCDTVREQTPPGTFGSCRQLHLERLRLAGEGEALTSAALHELAGSPAQWQPHLHRYAAHGGVLVRDWDVAREHYGIAFTLSGEARDALRAGWVCLQGGQPAVALDWLDRAFTANGGYPPPQRSWLAQSSIRRLERERYLTDMDTEAAFYDACRAAANTALAGHTPAIPDWPDFAFRM